MRLCGTTSVKVACACGPRDVTVGCGQHFVCAACRWKRFKRQRARIMRAMDRVVLGDGREMGPRELVVLATCTVRHSGDVDEDWKALMSGWRRFYRAIHKRGWAPRAYVGVIEVTPGRDGLGHVHLHVALVWPRIPWSEIHIMWRRACPQSTHIHLKAAKSGAHGAGKYVAKYVTKGCDGAGFSPLLRARVLAASYGRRQLVSSVGFFVESAAKCCRFCKSTIVNVKSFADFLGCTENQAIRFLQGDTSGGTLDDGEYVITLEVTGGARHGPRPQSQGTIHEAQQAPQAPQARKDAP
jgi:hypothetical protein